MRVFHFNTASAGGAAATMMRLSEGLARSGVESHVITRHGGIQDFSVGSEDVRGLATFKERLHKRLVREMTKGGRNLFTTAKGTFATPFHGELRSGDIVHLHWIQHWLDLPSFLRSVPKNVPIVWTAHDIALFSGGCHIYEGCEKFVESCTPCPLLKSPFDRFLAGRGMTTKISLLDGHAHAFVANSKWMRDAIERSRIGKKVSLIEQISPSIEPSVWRRLPKDEARDLLGIKRESIVLGFGAAEITDLNKNFKGFIDCLNRISEKIEVEALVFGDGSYDVSGCAAGIRFLGAINDTSLLSLCYSAMNVMVVPSFFETFGLVAVEAQACGTPVVSYEVGGLTDAVCLLPERNLVRAYDEEMLAERVMMMAMDKAGATERGAIVSTYVRDRFCTGEATLRYQSVYEQALATAGSR